ncbi:MAG TPA: hypothetical protein VGS80_25600 [Ktedonobacterales bacterium]|nr:hypothetical protein [Ktedonobacterales bacterium]
MPQLPEGGYLDADVRRLHAICLRTAARLAACQELIWQAQTLDTAAWQRVTRSPCPPGDSQDAGDRGDTRVEEMLPAGVAVAEVIALPLDEGRP